MWQEPDLRFHICGILFAFILFVDVEAVTEFCDTARVSYMMPSVSGSNQKIAKKVAILNTV